MSDPPATVEKNRRETYGHRRRWFERRWPRSLEVVRLAAARAGRTDGPAITSTMLTCEVLAEVPHLAGIHRVGGTVLRGLDGIDLPDSVRRALEQQRRQRRIEHLTVLRSIDEFGRAFDELDLRWFLCKGPALASLMYDDPGDRAYGDIDLFVHPADLGRAVDALEGFGYEHLNHHWRHAAWLGRGEFSMDRGSVTLDVHWHVQYDELDRVDLGIDFDRLFATCRRVRIGGVAVVVPSPEHHLMIVAHHATRSGGHRLMWSKDLERMLAAGEIDGRAFVELVNGCNLSGQVAVALRRAAALLDFGLPDWLDQLGRSGTLAVDRVITSISPMLRVDEQGTMARRWASSVRGTPGTTMMHLGRRIRRVARDLRGPPPSSLDDAVEKREFFESVARTSMP